MVSVRKGDLMRLEYTGRVAATGQIFETTDESVARKAGIFRPSEIYGPKLALFGSGTMMRGVEEAVLVCALGKHENFLIPPEKGFGARLRELVRLVPEKEFARQNVRPVPGMLVNLDGTVARVKSVTSGRVAVDFNHPLAGESLLYSLKVQEVISDEAKKIEAILSSLSLSAEVSKNGQGFVVSFPKSAPAEKVERAKSAISAAAPGTEFRTG